MILAKNSVSVLNAGFLPTYVTETAKKSGIAKPIEMSIALAGHAELISGEKDFELGHLDGRVNILDQMSFNDTHPVLNRKKAEWIIRQPAGTSVTVSASTPKASTATTVIELP